MNKVTNETNEVIKTKKRPDNFYSRPAQMQRLNEEIATIKESKQKLAKSDDKWWKLDAHEVAIKMILNNLVSLCHFCQREGAEIDFPPNNYKTHRECLRGYLTKIESNLLLKKLQKSYK